MGGLIKGLHVACLSVCLSGEGAGVGNNVAAWEGCVTTEGAVGAGA